MVMLMEGRHLQFFVYKKLEPSSLFSVIISKYGFRKKRSMDYQHIGRYVSLNPDIFLADPTPVDIDHAAHICHCIVRPTMFTQRITATHLL